ncbi:MAG: hypothetical protein HY220_01545 [Candidatus Sungbacteria bacterium]|uniref:Uncharacterized protein n=1 Tax=Candidatus Sungiibacteriota bacterium TaxID=2750080 RepID=A0A9D6LRE5_9BACT|nr:hypothetical protein [Candidatus Sungbacteria bacterium]
MPEQDFPHFEAGENPAEKLKDVTPGIRTMKSDISQFLKETKPSLVQMLSSQVESERHPKKRTNLNWGRWIGIGLISLIMAGILVLAGYLIYQKIIAATGHEASAPVSLPFFSIDRTSEISVTSDFNFNLISKIQDAALGDAPPGFLTRLVLIDQRNGSPMGSLSGVDFFKLVHINAPFGFLSALDGPIMPILFRSVTGKSQLGLIIKTTDASRALQALFSAEGHLAADWSGLFVSGQPPTSILPFQDRTYRNINYRILPLDAGGDIQLIYGLFPAKNYIIITTSEESFEIIISRLYQAS